MTKHNSYFSLHWISLSTFYHPTFHYIWVNILRSDTKLTAKQIVSEITSHAQELYTSPQGRRSLLYLIVPRTPRHFTPAQCTLLAETDVIRARTSKKDEKTRHDELLKEASGPLVELLESRTCAENMIRDPGGSLLITEIMLYAEAGTISSHYNLDYFSLVFFQLKKLFQINQRHIPLSSTSLPNHTQRRHLHPSTQNHI